MTSKSKSNITTKLKLYDNSKLCQKRWQLQFDGVATLRITAVWRDVSDVEVELGVGLHIGDRRDQQEVVIRQPAIGGVVELLSGKSNFFFARCLLVFLTVWRSSATTQFFDVWQSLCRPLAIGICNGSLKYWDTTLNPGYSLLKRWVWPRVR